jgi:hypothetical protein
MKCMILIYAQQDHDGMAGQATDLPAWSRDGFAATGLFMEAFNRELQALTGDGFDLSRHPGERS